MALPATRVVTGKYTDPVTGLPLAGSVIFSPHPAVWTDTAGNQIMLTREVVELDENGEFSQAVVRTDAPDVLPAQGKLWRFTENIRDANSAIRQGRRVQGTPAPARTFYFEVNDGVGPLDITDVAPTNPGEIPPAGAAGGDLTGTYPNPSLANTDLARTHLGLGNSATRAVGTTAGTVAAGDDSRVVNAVQRPGDTMTGALSLAYDEVASDVGHDLSVIASTGVTHLDDGLIQMGPTSVLIPSGEAQFVDPHHLATTPLLRTVPFGNVTVTLNNPADPLTYFMIDSTGAVVQNAGVPTRQQRREFAVVGRVVVLAGVINNVVTSPTLASHPLSMVLDLLDALGAIRTTGIQPAPIAGTMTFSLTAGGIFNLGANYNTDPNDPNVSVFNAVSPVSFRYVTRTTVLPTLRTTIDPSIYDVGGAVTTVPGGANTTTVQRVHVFPTQNVFI